MVTKYVRKFLRPKKHSTLKKDHRFKMEKYLGISKLFKWKFKATLATRLYKIFILYI